MFVLWGLIWMGKLIDGVVWVYRFVLEWKVLLIMDLFVGGDDLVEWGFVGWER